jgi:hypothetical protein
MPKADGLQPGDVVTVPGDKANTKYTVTLVKGDEVLVSYFVEVEKTDLSGDVKAKEQVRRLHILPLAKVRKAVRS